MVTRLLASDGTGIEISPGSGGITEFTDGTVLLSDGTKTIPAIRFTDDTNTGLYSPSNDILAVAGQGEDIVRFAGISSSVNYLTLTPGITGNGVEVSVDGTDTNVDVLLTPKGSGNLVLDGFIWPNTDGTLNQVLTTDGSGNLSFTSVGNLNNIVEDTTPQLGGDLDTNGFDIQFDDATGIRDNTDNEQLIFQRTPSAVNYVEITNADTGNGPSITAAGDDTNIDLVFDTQGTGNVDFSGNKLTNVVNPTNDQDAATKVYVDSVATGLSLKEAVRTATVAASEIETNFTYNSAADDNSTAIPLVWTGSETSVVFDGVTLNNGDRVLIDQATDQRGNGIFTFDSGSGFRRAFDADNTPGNEVSGGMLVAVLEGVTHGADQHVLVEPAGAVILGTDNLVWTVFSSSGGLSNIVEDTTPQLGGDLDTNSFNIQFDDATGILDSNGNEQIIFQETGSAVNYIEITNAATGNGPTISVEGGDSDLDLNLSAKNDGQFMINNTKVHINYSSAGAVTAPDNSIFILERDASTQLTILTPDADFATINLGSPSDNAAAQMYWKYDNNLMGVGTASAGATLQLNAGNFDDCLVFDGTNLTATSDYEWTISNKFAVTGDIEMSNGQWLRGEINAGGTFQQLIGINSSDDTIIRTADRFFLQDENNNSILVTQAGDANAVNYLQIANADSGISPLIAATGSDTNVDLRLQSKGNGVINLNDNTSVNGTLTVNTQVHIQQASSGATAGTFHDELVIESNTNCGLSILIPTNDDDHGGIDFGTSADNRSALIWYTYNGTTQSSMNVGTHEPNADLILQAGNADACLTFDGSATTATSDYAWTIDNSLTLGNQLNIPNGTFIRGRNNADSAYVSMIALSTGDDLLFRANGENGRIFCQDENNNETLIIQAGLADATDYLSINNQKDGVGPLIQALGDGSDIDLRLASKGNGLVKIFGDADFDSDVQIDGTTNFSGVITASNDDLIFEASNNGSAVDPRFFLRRESASPAVGDDLGQLVFQGRSDSATLLQYSSIAGEIRDPSAGAEYGAILFRTILNGSTGIQMRLDQGLQVGTPTGGDQGVGTINAEAVYDDGSLLTCYVIEAANTGTIDLDFWDSTIPDKIIPAAEDQNGNVITPESSEERTHDKAADFATRITQDLDPDQYAAFWKANGHLPAFPSPEEWMESGNWATGDLIQRLWETVEVLAVQVDKLNQRIKTLEGE